MRSGNVERKEDLEPFPCGRSDLLILAWLIGLPQLPQLVREADTVGDRLVAVAAVLFEGLFIFALAYGICSAVHGESKWERISFQAGALLFLTYIAFRIF